MKSPHPPCADRTDQTAAEMIRRFTRVRWSRFARAAGVLACCLSVVLGGCSGRPDAGYQFVDARGNVTDTFTCLGITDEQWKSVLKPGRYSADVTYCAVGAVNVDVMVSLQVWGVSDPAFAFGVPPNWVVPINIEYFTPFMFYRFPESVGMGGALWTDGGYDLRTGPAPGATPNVFLELYHTVHDGQVVSRGLMAGCQGRNVLQPGDYQDCSFLQGDGIADLVQLAFWAAQGLKAQYPDQFPDPLPAENPSPYVPPADGSLPTSTFTGTPNPPIHITPNRPSPTGESTP